MRRGGAFSGRSALGADFSKVVGRFDALVLTPLLGPADESSSDDEEAEGAEFEARKKAREDARKARAEARAEARAAAAAAAVAADASNKGAIAPVTPSTDVAETARVDDAASASSPQSTGGLPQAEDSAAVGGGSGALLDPALSLAQPLVNSVLSAAADASAKISASRAADAADVALARAGDALDVAEAYAATADRAISAAFDRFVGGVAARAGAAIDRAAAAVVSAADADGGVSAGAAAALAESHAVPGARLTAEICAASGAVLWSSEGASDAVSAAAAVGVWRPASDGAVAWEVGVYAAGDVLLRVRSVADSGARETLFRAALHVGFVPGLSLRLPVRSLDIAQAGAQRIPTDFWVEVLWEPAAARGASAPAPAVVIPPTPHDERFADSSFWADIETRRRQRVEVCARRAASGVSAPTPAVQSAPQQQEAVAPFAAVVPAPAASGWSLGSFTALSERVSSAAAAALREAGLGIARDIDSGVGADARVASSVTPDAAGRGDTAAVSVAAATAPSAVTTSVDGTVSTPPIPPAQSPSSSAPKLFPTAVNAGVAATATSPQSSAALTTSSAARASVAALDADLAELEALEAELGTTTATSPAATVTPAAAASTTSAASATAVTPAATLTSAEDELEDLERFVSNL